MFLNISNNYSRNYQYNTTTAMQKRIQSPKTQAGNISFGGNVPKVENTFLKLLKAFENENWGRFKVIFNVRTLEEQRLLLSLPLFVFNEETGKMLSFCLTDFCELIRDNLKEIENSSHSCEPKNYQNTDGGVTIDFIEINETALAKEGRISLKSVLDFIIDKFGYIDRLLKDNQFLIDELKIGDTDKKNQLLQLNTPQNENVFLRFVDTENFSDLIDIIRNDKVLLNSAGEIIDNPNNRGETLKTRLGKNYEGFLKYIGLKE